MFELPRKRSVMRKEMNMNQYDYKHSDSFKSNICGKVLPFVSKIHYNVLYGRGCIKAF